MITDFKQNCALTATMVIYIYTYFHNFVSLLRAITAGFHEETFNNLYNLLHMYCYMYCYH